MIIYF